MTRVRLSVWLLMGLLIFSMGASWYIEQCGNRLTEELRLLETMESAEAIPQCQAIERQWHKAEFWLLLLTRRDKVKETADQIYRLEPLAKYDNAEFHAAVISTQISIDYLLHEEGISLFVLI